MLHELILFLQIKYDLKLIFVFQYHETVKIKFNSRVLFVKKIYNYLLTYSFLVVYYLP